MDIEFRTPEGKEAKMFIMAMQSVYVTGSMGDSGGERAYAVITKWIDTLSDLTKDEAEALSPQDFLDCQGKLSEVLAAVTDAPTKK